MFGREYGEVWIYEQTPKDMCWHEIGYVVKLSLTILGSSGQYEFGEGGYMIV